MSKQRDSWFILAGSTLLFAFLFLIPALVTIAPDDRAPDSLQAVSQRLGCDGPSARRVFMRVYQPVDGPFGRWRALDRLDCQDMASALDAAADLTAQMAQVRARNVELNEENNRARTAYAAAKEAEERAIQAEALARIAEEEALRQNAELLSFNTNLRATVEARDAAIAELTASLRLSEEGNANLRSDLTTLTRTSNEQAQNLSALRVENTAQGQDIERLIVARDLLVARNDALRMDVQQRDALLDEERAAHEAAKAQIRELQEVALVTREELRQAQENLTSLYEDLGQAQAQISTLDTRILDQSAQVQVLGDLLATSQAEALDLDQQLSQSRARIAELEGLLELSRSETELTRGAMVVAETELTDRIQEIDTLRTEVEDLRRIEAGLQFQLEACIAQIGLFAGMQETIARWDAIVSDLASTPAFTQAGPALTLNTDLFEPGSPDFRPGNEEALSRLAQAMLFLQAELPGELDWAFLVRGHSDNSQISTDRFPSNWELSAARAASVVRYLANNGVAPARLQASGQGEFVTPVSGQNARRVTVEFQTLIYDLVTSNGL